MKCEFGYCTVCEKDIAKTCETCGHKGKTHDYTEVTMEWSNGAKMPIGVCVDCAKSHAWATQEAKLGITKAHWAAWDKANGHYDPEVVIV